MAIHKLMIKTHAHTGLKYLCYTRRENKDYEDYLGSGKAWKRHLKKHGNEVITQLIFESSNFEVFKQFAIEKSKEYNVVESDEWANLKIEEGDGGDTVSNKIWITDGSKDKYILKTEEIPQGWNKGRSRCVFNNRENQIEFSKRVDLAARGKAIKKAFDEGKLDHRDHSKCGIRGDANPSKRPEVRKMISDYAKTQSALSSERMKKVKPWLKSSRNNKKKKSNDTDTCLEN